MLRHLGAQAGTPVDRWASLAQPVTTATAAPKPGADVPLASPQDQQAIDSVLRQRPDLSLALQRLAGIDPQQRQQEYEAIRRELLRLSQSDPVAVELQADGGGNGGAATADSQAKGDQPEAPPQISPLSPQAVILQAYQTASRPDVPTSLLTSRAV